MTGRAKSMKRADIHHSRLLGLALQSIGDDLPGLVSGGELSEIPFDVILWSTESEREIQSQVEEAAREFGRKLEALGWRGVVFAASETSLADGTADLIDES
jgi:hypothetical protein